MIRLKYRVLVDWTAGTPVSVPIGGMNFSAVSQSGDVKRPNAIAPMASGKMFRAGVGRNEVANAGAVPT